MSFFDWLLGLLGAGKPEPEPAPPVTGGSTSHKHINKNVYFVNSASTATMATPKAIASATETTQTAERTNLVDTTHADKVELVKTKTLTKQTTIAGVIAVEAGYVNDPDDLGGETNFGITRAVALESEKLLRGQYGWDGTMRNLSYEMAYAIYEDRYWNRLKLDDIVRINPALADKLFDIAVNIGVSRAATWLQQALNAFNRKGKDYADLTVDGGVGNVTLTALRGLVKVRGDKAAAWTLIKALICYQGAHYLNISLSREANETFTMGWFNRLEHNVEVYREMTK